jgi:hypothetical protein
MRPKASASVNVARAPAKDDQQQELAHRGHWLLQSEIAEVAHQAKNSVLAAVVRRPEIRHY